MHVTMSSRLALLGGKPLCSFEEFPRDRTFASNAVIKSVNATMMSGGMSMFTSAEVEKFEEEFSEFIGSKYTVLVNSCTCAILAALHSLNLRDNARIGVPAYTYIGTCLPILGIDAVPVFLDIDPITQSISPTALEEEIKNGPIDAVICAQLFGKCGEISELVNICKNNNISIIYDCAQFLGNSKYTHLLLNNGLCCFSFGDSKILRIGEGGAVSTNSLEMAERIRMFRHEGEMWINHRSSRISGWSPTVSDVLNGLATVQQGLNLRPLAISAAIGRVKLSELSHVLSVTESNAASLRQGLTSCSNLILPGDETKSWWTFPVVNIDERVRRDVLLAAFLAEGIPVGVHFPLLMPNHPVFKNHCISNKLYQSANLFSENHFVLPIYQSLNQFHMKKIVDCVSKVVNELASLIDATDIAANYLSNNNISELNSGLYIFI